MATRMRTMRARTREGRSCGAEAEGAAGDKAFQPIAAKRRRSDAVTTASATSPYAMPSTTSMT